MKLYVCEKPSQGRDIARVLESLSKGKNLKQEGYIQGNEFCVTWCLGHLLSLAPPEFYCPEIKPWKFSVLPVIPKEWVMQPNEGSKSMTGIKMQLKVIQKLLKEADEVVIATDADREGDMIGREILDFFGYQGKTKRLWLSALDDSSIKKALKTMKEGSSTIPLYRAGLGRQRADWLIGMNATIATTVLFGQGLLSVGRVQTPTLNLIVTRDQEIENFESKHYFVLKGQFLTQERKLITATWKTSDECSDEEGRVVKRSIAEHVIKKIGESRAVVKFFKETEKKEKAPLCFSLSELQKLASSKFGFTAKETLKYAQSLYEFHKAITYPRTDCGYLPFSQFSEAAEILAILKKVNPFLKESIAQCDPSFKSAIWNDSKVTAHHGVIPTSNPKVDVTTMSEGEFKLYDLVTRYYLAQFLGDYKYLSRSVDLVCAKEHFVASGSEPVILGWKEAITPSAIDAGDEVIENNSIPKLTAQEELACKDLIIEAKATKPVARFTEGTLIDAMKNVAKYVKDPQHKKTLKEPSGIGTEATRANIIELLIKREYLERNKKQLISTKKGRELIDLIHPLLKDPITTARWEEQLDEIAIEQGDLEKFMKAQEDFLREILQSLKEESENNPDRFGSLADHPCPKCGKDLKRRRGKYGYYWACTGFPRCKHVMADDLGEPAEREEPEKTNSLCPHCKKGFLLKRRGKKKGFFFTCSNYPECDAVLKKDPNEPKVEVQVQIL